MNQDLKNKYYSLIENYNYSTLELINSVFSKIDTLLLRDKVTNQGQKILYLISVLETRENKLYNQMKIDIMNGVFYD